MKLFTKENGKLFVTVFVAGLAALMVHQKFVAPRIK
jgi:predicted negative regulator of RcsB-dependent stress response